MNRLEHSSAETVVRKIEDHNGLPPGALLYKGIDASKERRPFYAFNQDSNIFSEENWSDLLEDMHDESKEGTHPIDFYERKMVFDQVGNFLKTSKHPVICDFGCSTGYMLKEIKKQNPDSILLGVDIIESGLLKLSRSNSNIMLFKFDITDIPFPNELLDVVTCLNVLEHITDDETVLREFYRIIQPGGVCCLVVPYGKNLYNYYDAACKHVRRYGKNELITKCKDAGFTLLYNNFLAALLYPAFYFKKMIGKRIGMQEEEHEIKMKNDIKLTRENTMSKSFFAIDYKLSCLCKMPFGIREIVLLQKN